MIDTMPRVEVLIGRDLDGDRERELVAVFTRFGLAPEIKRERDHRGDVDVNWLLLVVLPLHSFLSGLGTEVVKDFYSSLRKAVRRRGREDSASGKDPVEEAESVKPIVLMDAASGMRVELHSDLPPEAFEALVAIDVQAYARQTVRFDRTTRRWRTESGAPGE